MTYEHIKPELVGNTQRVLISELSGTSNLLHKAQMMQVDLKKDDQATKDLLSKIKELEHAGYQFEEGEASFELMIKKALGKHKPLFELISYRITDEQIGANEMIVEATVKIRVNGKIVHKVGDGNGPVAALDQALRRALVQDYPKLKNIYLADYRVRVLDSKDGTGANVRVIIQTSDGKDAWGTVGVSTNIIEASWEALVDSFEYCLLE
jgi:2-isopropylmalate synthase